MPTLIERLQDMPDEFKSGLYDYIRTSITSSSKKHSAYGLQQGFNSQNQNPDFHVSVACFIEALKDCGYKTVPNPNTPNDCWVYAARN